MNYNKCVHIRYSRGDQKWNKKRGQREASRRCAVWADNDRQSKHIHVASPESSKIVAKVESAVCSTVQIITFTFTAAGAISCADAVPIGANVHNTDSVYNAEKDKDQTD